MDAVKSRLTGFAQDNSTMSMLIKAVLAVAFCIVMIKAMKRVVKGYKDYKNSAPWILKGTKNAQKRMIILQDPSKEGAKTLGRSKNEEGGLEFSYVMWMYIEDWSYKYGQWKHIMHKGNESSWPLRAPGMWLHPKKNSLRVYMNTFKDVGEFVDVDNIPLRKWFNVFVCVKQRSLDIYINGNLIKKKELNGLPRQNFGDIYINAFRGFSGYLSNMRYYDYYLSYSEMRKHLSRGPSSMPCVDSNESPPYLTANWWTN